MRLVNIKNNSKEIKKSSAFANILEQVEKERKRAKIIYYIGISVLVLSLLIFMLFSTLRIPVFSQLGDKILGREEEEVEKEVLEELEIEEETEGKTEEEIGEETEEEIQDEVVQRDVPKQPSIINQNPQPSPTISTEPVLKCSQYDFDYATAYIETAEKIYAEQYVKYLQELEKYDDCMYGKSWDQIYYECEQGLLAIINPIERDEYARVCVRRYYENCELNSAVNSYLNNLQNIETGINEQKKVLQSCY
jgi:hypothetical protein